MATSGDLLDNEYHAIGARRCGDRRRACVIECNYITSGRGEVHPSGHRRTGCGTGCPQGRELYGGAVILEGDRLRRRCRYDGNEDLIRPGGNDRDACCLERKPALLSIVRELYSLTRRIGCTGVVEVIAVGRKS